MKSPRFSVKKEKEDLLRREMERLNVEEKDLEEDFLLSGKKGGQNANKVATKVRLKHIPTGVEVTCSKERSQNLNRFLARRLLLEKIEIHYLDSYTNFEHKNQRTPSLAESKILKKKKQKAKRKKRSKEKYS